MTIPPNVLFISGGIGLGHVTRDLAIATQLRARCSGARVVWLAADPARQALQAAGEELLPESERYADGMPVLERAAGPFGVNLTNPTHLLKLTASFGALLRVFTTNFRIFRQVTGRKRFDLIIGDESYDIELALARNPSLKRAPFAMIYDIVGANATARNRLKWAGIQIMNWWWLRHLRRVSAVHDLSLFVGEEDDVPGKMSALFQPDRGEAASPAMRCVGYICPFDPADYRDRAAVRGRLGYGPEPLVVCSIGGTALGKALLELCGRAYPLVKRELPNLRMVLACGPRLSPDALDVPEGVDRRGYVYQLHEHFAACDLAIVQAGGTTTLELTALRRPFIYFPLQGHFEQQRHVARRLERHGAGVKLQYKETTPESLTPVVLANIGSEVLYPPIATDGARKAAELLCELMEARRGAARRHQRRAMPAGGPVARY